MLDEFWLGIRTEFLTISEMTLIIFLPFCTTYLSKAALLELMVIIKVKHQSAFKHIEDALYASGPNIQSRINLLHENKPVHSAH